MLHILLLQFLLFGFLGRAYAGPDPTPTDWLPVFNKIQFEGPDVVLDADVTRIRLNEGRLSNASGSPINSLVEKQKKFVPRSSECSVPQEVLSRYKNGYGEAQIMYCDLPERIWFATGGYCGEGNDNQEYNQGRLYSYLPKSGEVREYPDFLPKCAELAGMERINNKLVLATLYQGEYFQGPGQVLVYDLNHEKTPPKVLTNPHPTGAVVGMSGYNKQCDCLWFTTLEGIERLTIGKGKWEQRYLDYEISPDNKFLPALSPKKPGDQKMWLGRVLFNFPIEDLRGFVTAWNHSPASEYDNPRIGPLLLPFFMAAIERAEEGWSDWTFSGLVRIVASHQDGESKKKIGVFIEELLRQPMKLSRRGAVISAAKKIDVAHAKELEGAYFDDLLAEYFLGLNPKHSYENDVVRLSFEHPEYLPKLRDYYLAHTITFDVEHYFLDRTKQYHLWGGYEIIAEAIDQGQKRYAQRIQLLNMCTRVKMDRAENLLTILYARLETDAQVKFMRDPKTYSGSCANASHYWINFGDATETRRRVDLILDAAEMNEELGSIVLEVLSYKFGMNYNNLEEWKNWWKGAKGFETNNKSLTSLQGTANEGEVPAAGTPFSFRRYCVHYDVKADGTYTESTEITMSVDAETGVEIAKQFPVGMSNPDTDIGKRDVDILTAYTLKKNGQRIEAIRSNLQEVKSPAMSMLSKIQAKMLVFQEVAVGDTLIFSYKMIQKEAVSPGSVALTQIFPKFVIYEDVVISLNAPASMNLQVETVGIEAAKTTDNGGIRNWIWKYQNKKSEVFQPGSIEQFEMFPSIHVSSVKK